MSKRAAVLTADLFLSSQMEGAAQRAGCELVIAGTTDRVGELSQDEPLAVIVIDLAHPSAQEISKLIQLIGELKHPPDCTVAYTQHVQVERLNQAQEAGCDLVTTRGDVVRSLEKLLRD